ncbi:MAG TPA: protoporphyrinogen oxidase [Opitutaceae bacterium]
MTHRDSLPVAVVGGGITGLTAAYRLVQQGRVVRLFEAGEHLGGCVQSEREDGWLVEAGPNSVQENSPALTKLIAELELEAHKLYAQPAAKNRYIVRNGRPVPAPLSPPGLLSSPLFSTGAKLRVLSEILMSPKTRTTDISLAEFGRSHFGRELVDYGLNPFVSGVYAGNVEKLSTRHAFPSLWEMERAHGSIIRGQIKAAKAKRASGHAGGPPKIISFAEGLSTLPSALATRLPAGAVELRARVDTLVPGDPWKLVWSHEGTTHTEEFGAIVLALPAVALSRLRIGALGERPLAGLEAVEYPPVSSLFVGYTREQVAHPLDGFGVLVPSSERRDVLGVLFSSSLFPGRAPAGHVALTVMTGGALRPELARLDLVPLLDVVRRELGDLLGVRGEPVFVRHNVWPRAIPQYNLGYERFLESMVRCERDCPGLFIGGHVRDGIALPACVTSGEKLAARVAGG